jgi:large subunit ribosomal protein L6e
MSSKTKKLGSSTREVPAQKAQKWYPVDDEPEKKKVCVFEGTKGPASKIAGSKGKSMAGWFAGREMLDR